MYKADKLIARQHRRSPGNPFRIALRWNQARFSKFSWIVLLILALILGWQIYHDPKFWPIGRVKIVGDLHRISQATLRQVITPFLQDGWLNLDHQGLKDRLLQLAWMRAVNVTREWPNTLGIHFVVKQPVARLTKHLWLDEQGGIFNPGHTAADGNLPFFVGPASQYRPMLVNYQIMQNQLASVSLTIKMLQFNKQAWQVQLSNGIWLFLGHKQPLLHLQRFIKLYPAVIAPEVNTIDYIDLRYGHGMAMRFKGP